MKINNNNNNNNSNNNSNNNNNNTFNPRNMMIIPILNNVVLEYTNDGTILLGNSIINSHDSL